MIKRKHISFIMLFFPLAINAQSKQVEQNENKPFKSNVWVADLGNGTYKNPVINADYSDPDVIRVNDDYYLTSSSFEDAPGLPILHSKDLVNWRIIGHALKRNVPLEHFSIPRHGEGVYAPSIRYRNGEFMVYYPDPDFGIYVTKAKNPAGPWSEPILVEAGKGMIDPCPLFDEDGKVYLVYAFAGSRVGIRSVIAVKQMNAEGTRTLDQGVIVYDGHEKDPIIEGPKFYKRNGYYYIFAPAGGVTNGYQVVLRSKSVYGPYERRIVMARGTTSINGPHQGGWVTTQTGEDWFMNFQDKGIYGRVVHLNPMKWVKDWPVIGTDADGDGIGEPVSVYKKPNVGKSHPIETPADGDEFNTPLLGLQWQWHANPKSSWHFMNASSGSLRLYTDNISSFKNLWDAPNVLLQKFPADSFMVTTKLAFKPGGGMENEKAGLIVMGYSYTSLAAKSKKDGIYLVHTICQGAVNGKQEVEKVVTKLEKDKPIYLRVQVKTGGVCQYYYSFDGNSYTSVAAAPFQAEKARWKGSKIGLFATRESQTSDSGYGDFDWFRYEPI